MEIRPILSSLRHHKTGTILVALQIAVSLAVIANALSIINQRVEKISRPTGIDVPNIIVAEVRGFRADYDSPAAITRDLDALRALPGMLHATVTSAVPLSGSGSSTGLRIEPDEDKPTVGTAVYRMEEDGIKTLGVNLERGRNFYTEEFTTHVPGENAAQTPASVIVTHALAKELYPGEDPLGKPIYWGSLEPSTIVGIIEHMHGAWVGWSGFERNVIVPRRQAGKTARHMIRTEPGERDGLVPVIEAKLAELDPNRVSRNVQTHTTIMNRAYEVDAVMAWILVAVVGLLVGLTVLVTAGLASYFVSQRTKQIGTRRALGATRWNVVRYFMTENWIITTFGVVLSMLMTVAVSYVLETNFSLPHLPTRYIVACVLGAWPISLVASFLPARRAGMIPPAVATRTV